mmetsp:Transcript_56824/g.61595  ORF Transcript_56824/g.61595 Transcript_56824/m.61595 type:complete len:100 (-) Transcript_56824:29-328(-)
MILAIFTLWLKFRSSLSSIYVYIYIYIPTKNIHDISFLDTIGENYLSDVSFPPTKSSKNKIFLLQINYSERIRNNNNKKNVGKDAKVQKEARCDKRSTS